MAGEIFLETFESVRVVRGGVLGVQEGGGASAICLRRELLRMRLANCRDSSTVR
jgi:hypothetical protein